MWQCHQCGLAVSDMGWRVVESGDRECFAIRHQGPSPTTSCPQVLTMSNVNHAVVVPDISLMHWPVVPVLSTAASEQSDFWNVWISSVGTPGAGGGGGGVGGGVTSQSDSCLFLQVVPTASLTQSAFVQGSRRLPTSWHC